MVFFHPVGHSIPSTRNKVQGGFPVSDVGACSGRGGLVFEVELSKRVVGTFAVAADAFQRQVDAVPKDLSGVRYFALWSGLKPSFASASAFGFSHFRYEWVIASLP